MQKQRMHLNVKCIAYIPFKRTVSVSQANLSRRIATRRAAPRRQAPQRQVPRRQAPRRQVSRRQAPRRASPLQVPGPSASDFSKEARQTRRPPSDEAPPSLRPSEEVPFPRRSDRAALPAEQTEAAH